MFYVGCFCEGEGELNEVVVGLELQGGLVPVVSRVIIPINGLLNG